MRPGTPSTGGEAVADGRRVEAQRLAEGDDRQRVVHVEPAGQPKLERAFAPDGAAYATRSRRASSSIEVARTWAAASVP